MQAWARCQHKTVKAQDRSVYTCSVCTVGQTISATPRTRLKENTAIRAKKTKQNALTSKTVFFKLLKSTKWVIHQRMQKISPLIGACYKLLGKHSPVWWLSLDTTHPCVDVNPQSIQEWTLLAEMNMNCDNSYSRQQWFNLQPIHESFVCVWGTLAQETPANHCNHNLTSD